MTLNIKWNRKAIEQLDEAIKYIEVDSVANAKKVKKKILFKIDDLLRHPERYSPDSIKQKMTVASGHLNCIDIGYHTVTNILKSG